VPGQEKAEHPGEQPQQPSPWKKTADKHISEKVNKAYMMLGIIKRNFTHISRKVL